MLRRKLLNASTCRLFLLGTFARVLRLKPTNPTVSSVLHTCPSSLDMCHCRPRSVGPPRLPKPRLNRTSIVLTWSTWSLPCTLALVDVPNVSHYGWSLDLLVPQSKPHIRTSPLWVHRHDTSLLDLHLIVDHRLRAPHLHTTSQETCCMTQLMLRLVTNST